MTDFEWSQDEWARRQAEEAAFNALSLVEQNAIKLAVLEKEWSALGAMREITFTVSFREEDGAKSLASVAGDNGFDSEIVHETDKEFQYKLESTRLMKPIAESVTHWEEWFREQASSARDVVHFDGFDRCGAEYEGWSYPERVSPAFALRGNTEWRDHKNAIGARDRTLVLFGQTLCGDWYGNKREGSKGWSNRFMAPTLSPPFDLVPSEFLKNARRRRPSNPEPTASMFSQWLYSLYANAFGDDQDRAMGREAEEHILAERRKAYAATDQASMREHFPGWRLKHNGLSSNQSDRPNYYSINDLLVGGEPLRVLPDLIYENTSTSEIIIVEIKHSRMNIPSNLWPNIWGQLWCYAQIPEVRNSPKVTVIGEVWEDRYHTYKGWSEREERQYVYLRASVRRNPRAVPYDRFFSTLFDIYRGAD